jgi:adenosylcobinamide kinase/adenosylcobinamide-phosphate guanylyltransferase
MGELILVLGGARSGKTSYAQRLAHELGGDKVLFVATAEGRDGEMQERIAAHRRSRPSAWRTLEAPRQAGQAIVQSVDGAAVVLVDCLTLLVSNSIMPLGDEPDAGAAEAAVRAEVEQLLAAQRHMDATFIIVSNEVGLGLVPPYPLGRVYRDLLGLANQIIAAQAQRVYWMVAGIGVDIKALQEVLADRRRDGM